MAIQYECPDCNRHINIKLSQCRCKHRFTKDRIKVYWIDLWVNGKRHRERIGHSKLAAENRHREILTQRAEDRYIDRNKNARITIRQLCDWYLDLTEIREKRSYEDIAICLKNVCSRLGNGLLVSQLEMTDMERFRKIRKKEISRKGTPIKPATINRDVSNFKAALNKGVKFKLIESNPIRGLEMLEENNVREKVLSFGEFQKLLNACPGYLQPVVTVAYYLPMRQAEILRLTWDELDLRNGFIRLGGDRTKNKEGRPIPLHPNLVRMFHAMPRPIHGGRVFLKNGKPFNKCSKGFKAAVERSGLKDWTFHDLRHVAINNARLAGNDHFTIKKASGHKTDSAFKRYNLVTKEEMEGFKWLEENKEKKGGMDIYMDTKANKKKM